MASDLCSRRPCICSTSWASPCSPVLVDSQVAACCEDLVEVKRAHAHIASPLQAAAGDGGRERVAGEEEGLVVARRLELDPQRLLLCLGVLDIQPRDSYLLGIDDGKMRSGRRRSWRRKRSADEQDDKLHALFVRVCCGPSTEEREQRTRHLQSSSASSTRVLPPPLRDPAALSTSSPFPLPPPPSLSLLLPTPCFPALHSFLPSLPLLPPPPPFSNPSPPCPS
eukprot:552278-Hanusia_phi.AAC.2